MGSQDSKPGTETDSLLTNDRKASCSSNLRNTESHTELSGLLWIGLSAFLYTIPMIVVRIAFKHFLFPSTAAMVLRSGTQCLFATTLLLCFVHISPFGLSQSKQFVLFLLGVFGCMAMVFVYEALSYLPAGDVTAVFAFTPIITMLLSKVILKEATSFWDIVCGLLGMIGVWMIAGPESSEKDALGVVFVLLGSVSAALAYICVRGLGTSVHFMIGVFASGAAGIPITAVLGGQNAFHQIITNLKGTGIMLLGCLAGFLAQCCTNRGFQLCNPGVGVIMMTLEIPFGYLFSMWLLDEKPSSWKIVGSILVIAAVFTVGVRRLRQE
ncbi:unnamed protein product [Agarophyton chilense]